MRKVIRGDLKSIWTRVRQYLTRLKSSRERKRGELVLGGLEAGLRSIVQNSPYGIYRFDMDGRILMVNPALVRMLGYDSEADLLASPINISLDPNTSAQIDMHMQNQRQFDTAEVELGRKDGKRIAVRLSGRPVRDKHGVVSCFDVFVEDVTEKQMLEAQLRLSQRLESVGQLAGGVAHDFNNILTVIHGESELLLDRLSQEDPLHCRAYEIKKAAERAASLTHQLLAFSRKQVLEPRMLDLNAVIADMERMLRSVIGEDINLVTILEPTLGRVKADPGQIEQVMMNLVVNARDALPKGGKLTIETGNADLDDANVGRYPYHVAPGRYVMLAVGDTGSGMDPETQSRIFEPFFTTKRKGKGTGLGLATVYGIVKQSGGYIWVSSELGRGTMFKIYLPLVVGEQTVEAAKPDEPVAEPRQGSETVLVVEDEDPLRQLTREFLEINGYTVLEARNGPEAIKILERYKIPIQLLVTDVVMPEMSGLELVKRLTDVYPDMRVLYVSGYGDDAIAHHGILDTSVALLKKPFTRISLAQKVREVLDTGKGY